MNGESFSSPSAPPPSPETVGQRVSAWFAGMLAYFTEQDPSFVTAFAPALVVSALVFVRSPFSNYIFDEQEALLANPYVNGQGGPFWHAFTRDFWGLPPERSIGSYRPLPDLVWRALWFVSHRPFLHHWVNVVVHAVNGALVAGFVLVLTGRRTVAWLAGACFLVSAVLTEAVTGVVGIADVFGGMFVLLALVVLKKPLWAMPFLVFATVLLGLFSKESVLVAVPLVPWVALVSATIFHPRRPLRGLRALLAFVGAAAALVAYTYFRRRFFPVSSATNAGAALPEGAGAAGHVLGRFLNWFRQPQLPHDPVNNPLVDADLPHRIAGALRVYARGLGQVFFPLTLSGDYSFPQEPVPPRLVFPESVIGGLCLLLPPLAGVGVWLGSLVREAKHRARARLTSIGSEALFPATSGGRSALLAIGLVWLPLAYFPHSNIPVLLPTIRAERFWYLPVFGAACVLCVVFDWLIRTRSKLGACLVGGFFALQVVQARLHAFDYTDDLIFWRATHNAAPRSAKAQLNYSVMLGARGQLDERLKVNAEAMRLAPKWPMAHVYYGDTLCRLHRAKEAWPYYIEGFELAPNDLNLIALGLQCAWEEKIIPDHKDELLALSEKYPGSWLAFLASDLAYNGETNGGIQKKYRPRAYDEGPKQE